MPLSEHEQRILADIEARLRADDPHFGDDAGVTPLAGQLRTRLRLDVVAFVAGFALLFVGILVHLLWGLLGFGLMLGAAYHALTVAKRVAATQSEQRGETGTPLQRYLNGARRRDDDQG